MAAFFWTATGGTAADPTAGANWTKSDGTTGAAPGAGDDVYVTLVPGLTLAPISFGDSSAATFNSLNYSGGIIIGTNDTTSANFFGYWKVKATTVNATTPDGTPNTGGGRVKIWNALTTANTTNVIQTASNATDTYEDVLRLLLASASAVLNVAGGKVGVATNMTGETSTLGTFNVTGGTLDLGPGVTWTTGTVTGGTVNTNSGGTTLTNGTSGTVNTSGGAAITTINNSGTANLNHRTTTMATTINAYAGVTNFAGNPAAAIVTTLNFYPGAKVSRNAAVPGHITFTNLVLQPGGGTLAASA